MAVVGRLRTSISLDSAQFQQSMAGINRQLRGLKAETRAVTSSGTGFARGVDEMNRKADVLNRTLKVQQAQVKELRERYEQSRRATGENSKETQNANIQYQRAVAEMNKTENALKGLTAEIERQTNPWNKLSENLDHAGQKIQDFGRGMSSFGRTMSTRVTAPILGVGAGILKVGMDFEAEMSRVQALSGSTAEEMRKLSDQAKELGESTVFSASQAAEAQAFLAMAGYDTNSVLESMPGLLNLAASGNIDLGRAADITTNIMSAFNIEASKTGEVADVLAYASANANTNLEQMGEAMKYVAPTSNTLGLSIEDTAAAIMAVSDAGIQGSMAGRAFGTSLLRLANPTSAMADLMEELNISFFDAEGSIKSLPEMIEELENAMSDYNDEQKAATLSTIFGTEAQRHWSILLEKGSKELREQSEALSESEGTAEQMAETMQSNARGAMVEFRSAVEGVGIALSEHMIPAVTDIIRKGTELVRKFGELDEETQQNIIKMGLFAAAIGPVAMVAGSLTTAIGGVVRVGGSLVGLLGGTGGLLAKLGLMGAATGPVGLAIGAVGLLAGGIYLLTRDTRDNISATTDAIQKRREEIESLDNTIARYEELQRKNRLSTDEILRYMDVVSELENAKAEEAIQSLTEEQERLLEKSGLTNEEMEEFLRLNNQIVEDSPQTVEAISEQGNAYAGIIEEIKELNELERQRLIDETYEALTAELDNQADNLEKQKKLLEEIEELEKERTREVESLLEHNRLIRDIDLEIAKTKNEIANATGDEIYQLNEKLFKLEEERNILLTTRGFQEGKVNMVEKEIAKKEKSLATTEEELTAFNELAYEYEALILSQAGLNAEKGEGLTLVDEEIRKLEEVRRNLERNTDPIYKNTEGYQENVRELDNQLKRLKNAQSELKNINELASRTVYEKRVNIVTDPTVSSLNSMLSAPINKRIELQGYQFRAMAYAEGTNFHPGGPFIAGEEGWELGRLGDQWEILNPGLYDRPRGYQVFTHEESKKIMRSLNNIPKYATGTNMRSETTRIVGSLNEQAVNDSRVVSLLQRIATGIEQGQVIVMNDREVGRIVERHVTEMQEREKRTREAFA